MQHNNTSVLLLTQFLTKNDYDILLLQEPPSNISIGRQVIRGYSLFIPSTDSAQSHVPSSPPSVAIFAKSFLRPRPILSDNPRVCGIFISSHLGSVALISAYIHPTSGDDLSTLSSFITNIRASTPQIIVGADVNGHSPWWGPPDQLPNSLGQQVEDFVLTHQLLVMNKWPSPPTFISDQGFFSWIDATFASSKFAPYVYHWNVLQDTGLISDHSPLSYSLSLSLTHSVTPTLDWKRVCWPNFQSSLALTLSESLRPWTPLLRPTDIDAYTMILSDSFQKVIASHVPVKHLCRFSNPWWSPHLGELRLKVIKCKKEWLKHPTPDNKRILNNAKRELKNTIFKAKRESWKDFCDNTPFLTIGHLSRRSCVQGELTRSKN
jgi:hypothetical protein